jgi:hypothetical protein
MVIHPKRLLRVLLWNQRKEFPMDHGQLSMVADKCQWVFSEALLNACGTDATLCRRMRILTPLRLGLALTATCASQRVETLADFHRGFNAWFHTTMTYKAFYNQLAQPPCAAFIRTMPARLMGDMTLKVFGFAKGRACAALQHLILQDGSSFALHEAVRAGLPGCCKAVQPAAVALHTTMALLCDAPTTGVLPPDTPSDQAFLPEPASVQACWLLADRGSLALHSLQRVVQHGGCLLIRAKAGMHPHGIAACRADGQRLRSLRHTPLQGIHATLPKRQRVERVVPWQVDGRARCLRLLLSWHRRTTSFGDLLTNLAPQRYPLDTLCRAYTWRWHVA